MINVGIIGYGYWGPNLVRNFYAAKDCCVISVAETRKEKLLHLTRTFPSIKCLSDENGILDDPAIDAVIIATPVFTHFDLARKALYNGKHVLIEKPMTATVKEA